jgi:hypothetical protein
LKGCEEGDESSIIPVYCAFLKNALLPFQCTIKQLERDSTMAPELFASMEELKNKIKGRQMSSLVNKPRNF